MSDHANVAKSTVTTTALTTTSDTLTLGSGDGAKFPQNVPYRVRLGSPAGGDSSHEDVRVTAISSDTMTIHRGSNPQAWPVGSAVNLVLPADEGDPWGLGAALNKVNGTTGPVLLHGNSAQAVGASGATIATAGLSVSVVSVAANASTAILAAGTVDGQIVIVVNTDATHTVTFDAASTSKVADGAGSAIAALTARAFVWNATAGRWFRFA